MVNTSQGFRRAITFISVMVIGVGGVNRGGCAGPVDRARDLIPVECGPAAPSDVQRLVDLANRGARVKLSAGHELLARSFWRFSVEPAVTARRPCPAGQDGDDLADEKPPHTAPMALKPNLAVPHLIALQTAVSRTSGWTPSRTAVDLGDPVLASCRRLAVTALTRALRMQLAVDGPMPVASAGRMMPPG